MHVIQSLAAAATSLSAIFGWSHTIVSPVLGDIVEAGFVYWIDGHCAIDNGGLSGRIRPPLLGARGLSIEKAWHMFMEITHGVFLCYLAEFLVHLVLLGA